MLGFWLVNPPLILFISPNASFLECLKLHSLELIFSAYLIYFGVTVGFLIIGWSFSPEKILAFSSIFVISYSWQCIPNVDNDEVPSAFFPLILSPRQNIYDGMSSWLSLIVGDLCFSHLICWMNTTSMRICSLNIIYDCYWVLCIVCDCKCFFISV